MSNVATIETIKIDKDGRYLIVFKSTTHLSVSSAERFANQCKDISQRINNWWASDEKFLMLAVDDTVSVEFERIGPA